MISKLRELLYELRKPFNLFTTVFALIGTLSGFYFYYKSEKTPGISYTKSYLRIFDSQSASNLSLLDAGGNKIEKDVYALNILVWNSGSTDLGPEKIRRPMIFSIGDGLIVEAAIVAQSNDESRFKVVEVKPKSVEIKWAYFDPLDGFRLRIVCTQCTEKDVTASIRMLGLEGMEEKDEKDFSPRTSAYTTPIGLLTFFGMFAFLMYLGSRGEVKKAALEDSTESKVEPINQLFSAEASIKRKLLIVVTVLLSIAIVIVGFGGIAYVAFKLVPDLAFSLISSPRPNI